MPAKTTASDAATAVRWPRPRVLVAAVSFATYLALALVLGNLYPISAFEMYSAKRTTSASRVVARDASGVLREVDDYESWKCGAPTPIGPMACASSFPFSYTVYLDQDAVDWIDAHRGEGVEPVDIVRRIYRVEPDVAQPTTEDCVLQACRAALRK